LLGLGQVWEGDKVSDTMEVLEKHNLEPLVLGQKKDWD
jgi:histidine ammonia-lyase